MIQPGRRLLLFALGIVLAAGMLEWVVRTNVELFAGASQRARAELAMFEKTPDVGVLFLGTSRTETGISPELFQEAVKELGPELGYLPGYNAAFPGSTLTMLTSLTPRFAAHPGLRLVVIELSAPQVTNFAAAWENFQSAPVTAEDKLAASLQNTFFVRYRAALSRIPSLLIYTWSLALWETNKPAKVAIGPVAEEKPAVDFNTALWVPEILVPSAAAQSLNSTNERVVKQLRAVVQQYKNSGVEVVFAVPPLTRQDLKSAPEKEVMKPLFSEVARQTGCEVWNFNAMSPPDLFFYNPTHLNAIGRAHYSRAMAMQIIRLLKK